ncbi:DUF2332 family protein [Lichenihabitans psoromatis]|uniref:DUF2332 family protein n=1 Tax=Lichenihabitans psoromatis TaxID=2528642 RepID=UPI0010384940|nr:DUF2332 family protein [Lichenihabitans psoromatis]
MDRAEIVREAFRDQARHCGALGSPFTALLCDALAERLRSISAIRRRESDC